MGIRTTTLFVVADLTDATTVRGGHPIVGQQLAKVRTGLPYLSLNSRSNLECPSCCGRSAHSPWWPA